MPLGSKLLARTASEHQEQPDRPPDPLPSDRVGRDGDQPPSDSINARWSIDALTPRADAEPTVSGFIALAASRMAMEARSRTAGGTSGPETNCRRVFTARVVNERISARSRSWR